MFTTRRIIGRKGNMPVISFTATFIIILLSIASFTGMILLTAYGAQEGETRLVWTGEDGYHTDGLEPDSGLTTDTFEFRVMYLDDLGDDPLDELAGHYIHLVLDDDAYDLTTVDNEYSDGSIFNISMKGLEPRQYKYYFKLKVRDTTYRLPTSGYLDAPYVNSNPTLRTVSGVEHETTVYPEMGNTTDLFNFQILYSDPDNHPPDAGPFSRGVYIDNVFYEMSRVPGGGKYGNGVFTDGELYLFTTNLKKGEHRYYFQFTDEKGGVATSELFMGPTVITGFPDLMVKMDGAVPDIAWELPSSDPKDWDAVTITAAVENDGGSDIPVNESFIVDLEVYYVDPRTGDAVLEESWVFPETGLAVGKEHIISTEYNPISVGVYEVRIIVDMDNDIRELVEFQGNLSPSNNFAKVRFKVGPDLSISHSDIMPISAFNRDDLISSVTIRNTGPTDAVLGDDLTVVFKLGDIIERSIIPKDTKIAAGKVYKIGAGFYISTDKTDANISISVDPDGVLKEAINRESLYDNNNADSQIKVVTRKNRTVAPSFQPPMLLLISVLAALSLLTCKDSKKDPY